MIGTSVIRVKRAVPGTQSSGFHPKNDFSIFPAGIYFSKPTLEKPEQCVKSIQR